MEIGFCARSRITSANVRHPNDARTRWERGCADMLNVGRFWQPEVQ
jgi:hypothetical protein